MISGDALTDIDLRRVRRRHREAGGVATLAVKKVADTREYGVVLHDREGRITGFQEKPEPEEALSDLGNCGIYIFEPRDLRLLPRAAVRRTGRRTSSRRCWRTTCRSTSTRSREYWNDVGSLAELRQGTFDALRGELQLAGRGRGGRPRRDRGRGGARLPADAEVDGPVWVGRDVEIGAGVRLTGPLVLGDGARVGDGAQLRESIVFPGTEVAPGRS